MLKPDQQQNDSCSESACSVDISVTDSGKGPSEEGEHFGKCPMRMCPGSCLGSGSLYAFNEHHELPAFRWHAFALSTHCVSIAHIKNPAVKTFFRKVPY